MNIAIVGTFWLCEAFAEAVIKTEGVRYVAQYSRSASRARAFAERYREGVLCFDDFSDFAKCSQIDAVYLASPTRYHEEQARVLLQNGKHVLCEKPIALSPEGYRALCRLADDRGLIYMEAMMNAYVPELAKTEQCIRELGGATCARLDFSQRSSKLDAFYRGEVASSFTPDSGGALNDLGVYPIRLAIRLFGKVRSVQATAKMLANGADGYGCVLLGFDSVIAAVTYSKMCESAIRSEILCQNGAIEVRLTSRLSGVTCRISDGMFALGEEERGHAESMAYELIAFRDAVQGSGKEAYLSERRITEECVRVMDVIRKQVFQSV